MTQTALVPALKEWSAVVHALLAGRQCVLLRKGGIGEKRFVGVPPACGGVVARDFLLFPTVAHSHVDRIRPEHRDLLAVAAADSTHDQVTVRAAAKVVAALPVNRPDGLEAIADLHIWTAESVRADRLDFRPKHRLTVLVVSARPLVEPVQLTRGPEYAGCTSWVGLPVPPPSDVGLGAPVHDDATLQQIAARVRAAVGGAHRDSDGSALSNRRQGAAMRTAPAGQFSDFRTDQASMWCGWRLKTGKVRQFKSWCELLWRAAE